MTIPTDKEFAKELDLRVAVRMAIAGYLHSGGEVREACRITHNVASDYEEAQEEVEGEIGKD